MNRIESEKDYQAELLGILRDQNGYTIRKATDFDRRFAIDREMLFGFLNDTQPETMEKLRKIHKDRLEDTIVSFINAECTKKRGSLLEVLRHGVELSGHKLELMFTKPATTFNKDLMRKYEMNRFTVMEEVWANDKERIDVVIFLNGFAIISMELKCNYAGQSTDDAIYQYRMERDPKSRLFLFKAGTLVNFAMDLHEVYMTTKLDGEKTFFLPFNQGNGEGVNTGAGNAPCEDDYPVHYMWDDILTKDTILDLISKFIFIQTSEKENEKTGKVEVKESIIFPRYHQLDAVRKLLADVEENRTSLNYLIQHSAGSGKTNTIAWLAYRLATLHDADNKIIFDNVIIMTDRVVVDRQLQKAIMGMEHKSGLIRVMDEKCNSAKQAIEEGFILDVLQNYTTYKTFYQINKEIEEDPKMQTASAKRQIARFVELHETNIAQRIEVIVEHFRTTVMQELGGQAKAMVITASRQAAVKYCQAFEDYCSKKGYKGIRALVAFSGKVKLPDDDTEYTEPGINGIPEDRLTKEFDKDDYQVLLVANKYQTGFDQPKLCAMYVMKKLKGVNAVQTLSRLNRICPPFEKKTFILDFVNTYEDIIGAFAPYYTTTLLSNSVTPTAIYDLEAQIDAYAIIDPEDVDKVNEILYKEKVLAPDKKKVNFCLDKSQKLIEHYSIERQKEIVVDLRHFVRFYEFMIQVSSFEDIELHKKYNYIILLLSHINIKHSGPGFNLDGKIRATQFVQKKQDEHTKSDIVAKPVVKLPSAENFGLTPAKEERLSEIIAAINARTGKAYDSDVAVKAMLQIRDILMKSDKLKASAKNNTVKDFEFSYFDDIDDALIEGLEQNQDFFSLLLNDEEIKREVLGIFTEEIYNSLKKAAEE